MNIKTYKITENDIEYDVLEYEDGDCYWYIGNDNHRESGPCVTRLNGSWEWKWYGKPHRADGPAVRHSNGDCFWIYEGELIDCTTQEQFEQYLKLKAFW